MSGFWCRIVIILSLLNPTFVKQIILFISCDGTSTKKTDSLKLIGTSFTHNGKFAWIELNGGDYGWLREGRRIGDYLIVGLEMGRARLDLYGKVMEFEMDYYERQEKGNKSLRS